MRPWCSWRISALSGKGCRFASWPSKGMPVRMIGVVNKVFPDRGYGFVLAVPPPASLLPMFLPSAEWTVSAEEGTPEAARMKAAKEDQQRLLTRRDALNVWFGLRRADSSSVAQRSGESGSDSSPPSASSLSPGVYVTFIANCHYDAAKEKYVWRTREVVPCDAEKELEVALRRVCDLRWERITLEDMKREKQRFAWRYALEEEKAMKGASWSGDAPLGIPQHLLREGGGVEAVDDVTAEEFHIELSMERASRHFQRVNKTTPQFVIHEGDLRRPLSSIQQNESMQRDSGKNEVGGIRSRSFSEDEKKRWECVVQSLHESE